MGRLRGPTPAPSWNPPDCGDIDMRIAADGTWFYCGSPIGRAPLVQLFASIMRKEGDRYVLVTPVEKVGIKVDDAPFVAVEMRVDGEADEPQLTFRTNVEDLVTADGEHPLRFERGASEGLKPYVRVRGDLWALVKRALFYDLVALGRTERFENEDWFGVRSRRSVLPDVPGERNRGALSADLVSDLNPASLRGLARRKLAPSLEVEDLERATPLGPSDYALSGHRVEPHVVASAKPAAVLAAARQTASRADGSLDVAGVGLARPFGPGRLSRRQDRPRRDAAPRGVARGARGNRARSALRRAARLA